MIIFPLSMLILLIQKISYVKAISNSTIILLDIAYFQFIGVDDKCLKKYISIN